MWNFVHYHSPGVLRSLGSRVVFAYAGRFLLTIGFSDEVAQVRPDSGGADDLTCRRAERRVR